MTGATDCVPVSWLRLERYALGELGESERAEIAGHLGACARCQGAAAHIARDADRVLAPLRPMPVVAALPAPGPRPRFPRATWRGLAAGVAAAGAVFALVLLRPRDEPASGARVIAVKGGEVAVELVRERAGSTAWEPSSFVVGDRFKLLLTCPQPLRVHADLVVLQADGAAFPGPPAIVSCGNRVPLPPAFRITGAGAATICVAVDPTGPPSRARMAGGDAAAVGPHACLHLERGE